MNNNLNMKVLLLLVSSFRIFAADQLNVWGEISHLSEESSTNLYKELPLLNKRHFTSFLVSSPVSKFKSNFVFDAKNVFGEGGWAHKVPEILIFDKNKSKLSLVPVPV